MYQFDDDVLAVGIDRRPQHQDDVVEDRLHLRVVGVREQVVGELQRVLAAGDFGRVQPAVDVDEGLPFARQPVRLGVGQPFRVREPLGDLAVAARRWRGSPALDTSAK